MKPIVRWTALSVAALVVVGAGGGGAWYGWETGRWGSNPRAPTPQAVGEAARKQALQLMARKGALRSCLPLELGSPPPEQQGLAGIAYRLAPGQQAVTLLVQTQPQQQPARDLQLAQLNYLVGQGLFAAGQAQIEAGDADLAAMRYQLTWDGYKYLSGYQGGGPICLGYGQREATAVVSVEPTTEKVGGLDVYEVLVQTAVKEVPAWASTVDAKRLFTSLSAKLSEQSEKARIVRTAEGWRPVSELEAELQMAAAGRELPAGYFRQASRQLQVKAPSVQEARDLVAAQAGNVEWSSRHGVACLPLRLQRGGDDEAARRGAEGEPYTVMYYDRADRKEHEYRTLALQLQQLTALEAAGLATMEVIKPLRPAAMSRNQPPPPVTLASVGGVRYTLLPEAVSGFRLANGGGCIPAGRLKVELLHVQAEQGVASGAVRGAVEQIPDWATKLAAQLPALKVMLDHGVPLRAAFSFSQGGAESQPAGWRLSGLEPLYPEIAYDQLPPHLALLLPNTFEKAPKPKRVQAPSLVQPGSGDAAAAAANAAATAAQAAQAARAAAMAVQPAPPSLQPPPAVRPTATPAPVAAKPPPYPAGAAPVHAIAQYSVQGGVVHVQVEEPGSVIVLWAYETVEWRVHAPKGLKQVVVLGYEPQRVTYDGPGKPPVVAMPREEIARALESFEWLIFPHSLDRNEKADIARVTRALTGKAPDTFQKPAQQGSTVVGAATPKFAIPPAVAVKDVRGPIALKASSPEITEGTVLRRGPSGAYTEAWTDKTFSAGQGYFEGTMRVTGSLTAHTYANVGVCVAKSGYIESSPTARTLPLGHGQQQLYKNGDVFGVAVDFDRQRVHYRVNGQWLDGAPGGDGGRKLEADKEYRACAMASGTVTGEVKKGVPQSDTTWDLNFGGQPFKHPPPAGFLPLAGR